MKRALLLMVVFVLVTVSGAQAIELDKRDFPQTLKAGDRSVLLNGWGVRKKLMVPVYSAGLYLPGRCSDHKAIINNDQPMLLRLHIVSRIITPKLFIKQTLGGFERSTNGNMAPLQDRIDMLVKIFETGITKDDVYDMVYIPGEGTLFYKNSKFVNKIEGLDFKQALYGVWLVEDPYHGSVELRNGLLGF